MLESIRQRAQNRPLRWIGAAATLLVLGLGMAASLGLTGCSDHNDDTTLVAAAASLRGPLEELVELYREQHPDANITLTFGGSGALAQQIRYGAPVDLFLSADAELAAALV